ncbi:binding--dependent transport system inner membrane component family protein [Clostridium argentinense CDC 2741]|uniref:Binding--dependent transport system inner membrane component family protein n=1 Tax=Clostridium argentinense CDC 2741 TaxID=1418104 RepID=A0A0C1U210_9CLOT|nr:ABC transporter permease [Clostridium argentinense]ARC86901.1 diguanylate cyclase [Clostridium argentinense]KIE45548.1 binding--dependent transport system inner membrane component family protein [Clostridium argentinense CDC 2741]NFF40989.1 ABC transporter permease [Clostridium argentinense]NFP51512.1 ABC transporter permease [Clostridium argentinense]NFP73583.1 ABC transporter permease [Clostridium argentinense]
MRELKKKDFEVVSCEIKEKEIMSERSLSYWQSVKIKFFKNKIAILAVIILLIIILMTIFSPIFTKFDYFEPVREKNLRPNSIHYFGTTDEGRDIFAGVWQGARSSLGISCIIAFLNLSIGIVYGGICSFYGGIIDDIIMRILEIVTSVPLIVIITLMYLILGSGPLSLILAMTINGWDNVARLIRGQLLQIKEQEYVLAAKALGASTSRIICNHLIRNVISVAIVTITMEIPNVLILEGLLSYIGFGMRYPLLSWGSLMYNTGFSLMFYPYQIFIPASIMTITIICFNVIGDVLRDALNPQESIV